jgi:hypothetical protein
MVWGTGAFEFVEGLHRHEAAKALMQGFRGGIPCQGTEVSFGIGDALTSGALEPRASFFRIELASGAGHKISAKHELGVPVAKFCGCAEPPLRSLPSVVSP